MMEKQLIPVGYKQTEVGVIPEDWAVKSLGELVSSVEYGSSAKSSETGLMPVLRMGNLQSGKIDWNDLVYTSDSAEIAKYKLNKNDVLFNRTNTVDLVGKTSIYKGEYPAVFAGYLIRINRIESLLDADYLNYVLNSHHSKIYSKLILSVAVSQANINGQKLKTYPIPTPPTKKEQTDIANSLSDVDALIAALEKLINKKSAIKTAAMQQLLTGKKRLPPFDQLNTGYKQTELGEIPGDWEVIDFGDLFQPTITRKPIKQDTLVSFVGMQDVSESAQLISPNIISHNEVKSGFTYFEKNDVLVAKITPCFENGKGCIAEKLETNIGFGSTEFHVLRANEKAVAKYIYFITTTGKFRKQLESEMVGSAGHRRVPMIAIEKYRIPCSNHIEEQTAIATVLSDMDKDLETLQQRLHKTQQIKQGMMQELLTGKTRLVQGVTI